MAGYGMFVPYTATFLTFSDYMRPTIRLAALSELQVIHVFTHDSIFLGEDGPTHQSVEHVAALRLIPNVDVWRPGNALECAAAWGCALERRHGPSEIILSRQKVNDPPAGLTIDGPARGGYVLIAESGGAPDLIVMATGSELGVAMESAALLSKKGKRVRVVSLPCVELFARQPEDYRGKVLPKGSRRVSIEAGVTAGWHQWVGEGGLCIGIDTFGASAPAPILAEKFGLTAPLIAARIESWL